MLQINLPTLLFVFRPYQFCARATALLTRPCVRACQQTCSCNIPASKPFLFYFQVRATNLQELVYKNGQAGITKASVSVTFDNRDKKNSPVGYEHYDEVVIQRQVRGCLNDYSIFPFLLFWHIFCLESIFAKCLMARLNCYVPYCTQYTVKHQNPNFRPFGTRDIRISNQT